MIRTTDIMSGSEYELLTKSIYEALLRSEGVETITVEHNIEIAGRSGCSHRSTYFGLSVLAELSIALPLSTSVIHLL